jgi:hypothetical protein
MQKHDAATEFTLKYLELLERHLKVAWSDACVPICITDWIQDDSIAALRVDLEKLVHSDLERDAREATIKYGVNHIQTVGFGLAPDFDQFIKLGLIYGERVVLWDVIHSRILVNDQQIQARKSLLAQITCNLLMLRSTVERGGVVLLSHPIVWSTLAAGIDKELRAGGPAHAASLGLSLAFAAIEEGLPLHPYTLLKGGSKPKPLDSVGDLCDELFSAENFRFQQCIATLLRDSRVAYLEDVPLEEFFNVVSRHANLRRALRKHFSPTLAGLSPQQAVAETHELVDELFALIDHQNAAVVDYAAEGIDASAKLVLAGASSAALGLPLLSALTALGSSAVHLSTAVRKWAKKPAKNVIIQTFRTLERVAATNQAYDPVDVEYQLSKFRRGQCSLGEIYEKFMSFDWTEQRHDFLKSLPQTVAKALLETLSSEDLEVIVNWRRFQQDYIGDYLVYLSELDEAIYWEHLGKTFECSEGLLTYDDDAHIVSMETQDMPLKTWQQLLDSLFDAYASQMRTREYDIPLERFPKIIRFQTEEALDADEKRSTLILLASRLESDDREALTHLVSKAFEGAAPEWFAIQ